MAMIRPETEMKDSGIEYLGEIPTTWEKCRLKNVCTSFNSNITTSIINKEHGNYKIFGASGLIGYIEFETMQDEYLGIVKDGAGVGRIGSYPSHSSLLGTLAYIIPNDGINMKWLKYVIENMNLGESIDKTTIPHIYFSTYGNNYIPFPSSDEQQAIADYLDETCSKIDEIIAEANASIDEYKELKQSVIFEAVTKGLDKDVEMKDSGYDFIGCIPSEWEMCKVRHLGTAQNGISIGGDAFGSGHPFVSYGDVYKNYSLPKTVDKLVQSSEEDRKRYSVEKGDWFFTRTSETIEEVGFSCVCEETIPEAVFAGFLIRVHPFNNRIYTGFAKYYFRSNHLRTFFVKEMNLVTRASLAQGLLKDAPVVVPPYDEQIEIANYLENKCEIIDGVIKDKESTINDLESYKKSLIYEVITGKRRVV